MQYSYSRINVFNDCKAQYYIRYVLGYKEQREISETDPLLLGKALHVGLENRDPKSAINYYIGNLPRITDVGVTECYKLEELIKRGLPLIPQGQTEVELKTDKLIGYADLISDKAIYDFKYCSPKNFDKYGGEQLNLYRSMLGQDKELYYVFFPKLYIRQKKSETIYEFRCRVKQELGQPQLKKVEVNNDIINKMYEKIQEIERCTTFEKTKNLNVCKWCSFRHECQKESNVMNLPKAVRQPKQNANKINIWVYGEPGEGKTYFANTAKMPLMLNTDSNAKRFDAPAIAVKDYVKEGAGGIEQRTYAWDVFLQTINELEKSKDTGYDTIVVDLLEDIYEACRSYVLKKNNWDYESDAGYGKGWDMVRKPFLDAIKKLTNLPYNIILISHQDKSHDTVKMSGDKVTDIKPNIQDKLANKISGMCDFTARVENRQLVFDNDVTTFGVQRLSLEQQKCANDWNSLIKNIKKGE